MDATDEPPAAYLPGSSLAAQVYSPAYRDADEQLLCHSLNLPELIEISGGDLTVQRTVLNLSLPRVREQLAESCLVRPGDRVVAVGRGWQVERTFGEIIVQSEPPACPDDAPFGLWMAYDAPLPEDPLFVTTDLEIQPRDNRFVPAERYPVAPASAELLARLKGIVEYPEDFRATIIDIRAPELEAIVLFERRTITFDDDALPSMIAVAVHNDAAETLWSERVDARRGTGRFEFVGTLDFDGDGRLEIVLAGAHQGCPYTVVFRRGEGGFDLLPLPHRACRC